RRAIDEHGERAGPRRARATVGLLLDATARIADLHDRSLVDEQAGQVGRFVERTAAVVAQVDDHAVDALLAQFAEQALDIARGTLVVRIAAPARLEILVERRQRDHADTTRRVP